MTRVRSTGREHVLKTWPEPFQAIVEGYKAFEVRKDDRGFAVGDTLVLKEWDPRPYNEGRAHPPVGFTGRWLRCTVQYLVPGGSWGLPEGLCVMSLGDFEQVMGAIDGDHRVSAKATGEKA